MALLLSAAVASSTCAVPASRMRKVMNFPLHASASRLAKFKPMAADGVVTPPPGTEEPALSPSLPLVEWQLGAAKQRPASASILEVAL